MGQLMVPHRSPLFVLLFFRLALGKRMMSIAATEMSVSHQPGRLGSSFRVRGIDSSRWSEPVILEVLVR